MQPASLPTRFENTLSRRHAGRLLLTPWRTGVLALALSLGGLAGAVAQGAAPASASSPAVASAATRALVHEAQEPMANLRKAAEGQSALIEPSAEALVKLSQAHPGDVVVLAYAGAATTLRATTTLLPWRKMRFADDGLALLDKALAQLTPADAAPAYWGVPAVLDVKLVAANTFLALPGMFNRHDRGLKLLSEVANHPLLKTTPQPFQEAVAKAQRKAQER